MPTLEIPSYEALGRLFAILAEENAELLPGCRWLVLGPQLAAIVVPDEAPSMDQMVDLLRLLRQRAPELEELGRALVYNSEHGEEADVEACIDKLLEVPNWQHPSQVLDRPRPGFHKLLEAGRARGKQAGGGPAGIGLVIERLEVAVEIAETARVRRERMKGRTSRLRAT